MVLTNIFLEVNIPAAKKFLQLIESIFIFLYQLHVESWLCDHPPFNSFAFIGITQIYSEATFTIY